MLQPAKINKNRKVELTTPFVRLLYGSREDAIKQDAFWHLYMGEYLTLSGDTLADDDYELVGDTLRDSISTTMADGLYIRPPKAVPDHLLWQFEPGTQTVAEFLIDITGNDMDTLLDAYNEDTSYFASRDEFETALQEKIPRFAFLLAQDAQQPADGSAAMLLTRRQAGGPSLQFVQKTLSFRDIVEDDRIFAALDGLDDAFFDMPSQRVRLAENQAAEIDAVSKELDAAEQGE